MVPLWTLCTVLGLSLIAPISRAQSGEDLADNGSGFIAEEPMVRTRESREHASNSEHCSLTFYIPGPSVLCRATEEPPVSQEELVYLKYLIQDTNRILQSLQHAVSSEAGQLSFQDAILEALGAIREDKQEFDTLLHKVTQEFHTKMEDGDPGILEEEKKLRKDFLMMEHLLKITSRLAEQIDSASQDLNMALTQHIETSVPLAYRTTAESSERRQNKNYFQ